MCLTGGLATKAYTVCMIALLPDKTRNSYESKRSGRKIDGHPWIPTTWKEFLMTGST